MSDPSEMEQAEGSRETVDQQIAEQEADRAKEGSEGDRSDQETGSTQADPAVEDSGPPPGGSDPMSGPAPSG